MGTQQKNRTGRNQKAEIIRLVRNVNRSKKRVERGLLPLTFMDEGWRLVFSRSLEFYDFLPSGRKLLEMSVFDVNINGEYYWIPYSPIPKGVVTPAIRLMVLGGEGNE